MKYILAVLFFSVVIAGFFIFTWNNKNKKLTEDVLGDKNLKNEELSLNKIELEEKMQIPPVEGFVLDQTKKYNANIRTSAGDILVELNSAETPFTVNNFVY